MTAPITHRPLAKAGRKPKALPALAAETIADLAADGWSIVGIAHRMGVDPKTFRGWLERDPALQDALDLGREQEHHVMFNVLYRAATEKGNITAALGILNARHGYRSDQADSGGRVNVTIALPGAMTLQQFNATTTGVTHDQ